MLCGPGRDCCNHFKDGGNTATWNYAGSAARAASGYGGGIFLAGGVLNLLANSTITTNTVQGQNGAAGRKEARLGDHDVLGGMRIEEEWRERRYGREWRLAGGGVYQQGGTLYSPVGAAQIEGNYADPGAGGAGGSGGDGGFK